MVITLLNQNKLVVLHTLSIQYEVSPNILFVYITNLLCWFAGAEQRFFPS